VKLARLGVDHPYVPLLLTVPGVGYLLAYTIASEIGDIARFASPKKLTGYTGLCPIVRQSGNRDVEGHWPRTARSTCAGRLSKPLLMPLVTSAIETATSEQAQAWPSAWRQSCPGRHCPPARRSHLACPD